ncbi:hypothetical protein VTN00DRAFT_9195 [Thermoascus crustaceus]|uniref:uncharacterized protein n=1 Tax=Thermoascus crustaceus TaxID=5088 RepID=UPI0037424369
MSNQQVGMVFDRVIQEVCDASQVDFEEGGVDQQTLEEMRKSWQKKLSSLGVAQFPWDPQPQPAPPQPQNILPPTATVPSNAPRPTPPQQQQGPPQHLPQSLPGSTPPVQAPVAGHVPPPNLNGQGPRIKTEPGVNGQSGLPTMNPMPPASTNPQSARERAANALHQRYGAAAANSVSQLQAQSQAALSLPGQQRPQVSNGQGQDLKPQQGYQNPPQLQRPPVSNAQTDGASDALLEWKAEVARRRAAAARQNGEGDRLLREQLSLQRSQLEGGGLMLPLEERYPSSKTAKRRLVPHAKPSVSEDAVSPLTPALNSLSISGPPRSQYDGPDDDDERVEDDEDAINSDLDDPDDLVAEEHEGEDAVGQVMLCTYDKVQRVKNKWKCTLKDGILTTGGKEYVFHKGQGEFEW